MHRNQGGRSWRAKAATFAAASTTAGILAGAALGILGTDLDSGSRLVLATIVGVAAVGVGLQECAGGPLTPLQCNRETPQAWMSRGPIQWASWNGAALGLGAASRIGFWLWYVIPIGALLSGNAGIGALLYGTYAVVRGIAPVAYLLVARRLLSHGRGDGDTVAMWLLLRRAQARAVSGGALITVALACVLLIG